MGLFNTQDIIKGTYASVAQHLNMLE